MRESVNGILRALSAGTLYWLKGRAIGALIFACFGASDMLGALSFARNVPRMWSVAIWIVAVTLGGWSIRQRFLLRRLSVPAVDKSIARQHLKHYAAWFFLVVVIEVVSINLGRSILIHFHRLELFPQWVGGVVGLHFLPLAKLFKMPLFYATGTALVSIALGSLLIAFDAPRAIAALAGSGLCLWATPVVILLRDATYIRKAET
jgi:hypothetical protein